MPLHRKLSYISETMFISNQYGLCCLCISGVLGKGLSHFYLEDLGIQSELLACRAWRFNWPQDYQAPVWCSKCHPRLPKNTLKGDWADLCGKTPSQVTGHNVCVQPLGFQSTLFQKARCKGVATRSKYIVVLCAIWWATMRYWKLDMMGCWLDQAGLFLWS